MQSPDRALVTGVYRVDDVDLAVIAGDPIPPHPVECECEWHNVDLAFELHGDR